MILQWDGPLLAAATVATIAAGHTLVRRLNWHFGTRPALPLLTGGIAILAMSLFVESNLLSGLLGIVGVTTIVDGVEIRKQERRIREGRAPMNPRRPVTTR